MNDDKQILIIASIIRVILTIWILYYTKYPTSIKILLIMISDFIDCDVVRVLYKNKNMCQTHLYQKYDKIIDMICYTLLLNYIYPKLDNKQRYLIIFLFLFRLYGVIMFLKNKDRKYLFYFPNIFLWTLPTILFYGINYQLLLIITFFKLLQEYYLHYR